MREGSANQPCFFAAAEAGSVVEAVISTTIEFAQDGLAAQGE
jgi:hypothetical protein